MAYTKRARKGAQGTIPSNPYNDLAWIIGNPKIGEGTWIGAFTLLDGSGGLEIGKGCDISCGAQIYTHSTVKRCVAGKKFNNDGSVNRESIEQKPVKIGDHSFIGPNATILMGVTVGKRCVIGAGAVVTKDVKDYTVVAGVPAEPIATVLVKPDGEVILQKLPQRKKLV